MSDGTRENTTKRLHAFISAKPREAVTTELQGELAGLFNTSTPVPAPSARSGSRPWQRTDGVPGSASASAHLSVGRRLQF